MIELTRPHARLKESYLAAVAEYQNQGEYTDLDLNQLKESFDAHIEELLAKETSRSATRVPDTIYWAIDGQGEFVGRISLRHELNEFLSRVGGHIGYDVRPSKRGMGYATEMLRLCLQTPKAIEIGKLFLTCDVDNPASQKVILKNSGVLSGRYKGEPIATGMDKEQAIVASREKLQFWINTSHVPTLETKRLTLTRLRGEHASEVFAYASDPEVAKTVTWDPHTSVEASQDFIADVNRNLISDRPNHSSLVWAIFNKAAGRVIGTMSFHQHSDLTAQIDYAIGRTFWNKGFTTEASNQVVDWAFNKFETLQRIQASCLADNEASKMVMLKIGMRSEGIRRSAMRVKGKVIDLAIFAITRTDWTT